MQTITDARAHFETRLHEIDRMVGSHFRHLDPDAKEEAVQNAVALALRYWLRLAERRKTGEGCFRGAIWWAVKHTKQGRRGGGRCDTKPKCVMDYARRRKGNVAVQGGVDLNSFVGATASVPETVAFRLDVPAFLGTLPERDRGIAASLAQGMGTTEVAREIGVSPAAISQFRVRFKRKYDEFNAGV